MVKKEVIITYNNNGFAERKGMYKIIWLLAFLYVRVMFNLTNV